MQFNSYIFILLFLPVFVLLYFLLNRIGKLPGKLLIIVAGLLFTLYAGTDSFIVLCVSAVLNLLLSIVLSKIKNGKKIVLAAMVILNIALLLYYKYTNFVILSINSQFGLDIVTRKILIPLGISFFTFQQITYALSVCRGEIEKVSVPDFLAYTFYFPKLIMGPLAEAKDFIAQLNDSALKKFQWENLAVGIKLFSFGLFKKMILADTFSKGVSWGFTNLSVTTAGDLFLVMLFYTFEIYFDFSGYSDMAVGVSKMINITLPMNFDSPYKALSIRDFWKRWHMSLTGFLTKNVYFPLGGSRKGTVRTYINIMIVFLVSGIWHGANWTFILWGVVHGLLQILERVFDRKTGDSKNNYGARWLGTFMIINLLWLLFRSESIGQWIDILKKMFAFGDMRISKGLISQFVLPESAFIFEKLHLVGLNGMIRGFSMAAFTIAAFVICLVPENNYRNSKKLGVVNMLLCAAAFTWAFLCLSSESVFVYFNF